MRRKSFLSLCLFAMALLTACSPVLLKTGVKNGVLSGSVLVKKQTEAIVNPSPTAVPPTETLAPPSPTPSPTLTQTSTPTVVPTNTEAAATATSVAAAEAGGLSPTPPTNTPLPSPEATMAPQITATASPTAIPDTAANATTNPPTVQPPLSLVERLARLLMVSPQQLEIRDLKPVIWPDLCFDFKRKNSPSCNQLPTPGYQGRVTVLRMAFGGDPQYEFRSDERGDLLYLMPVAALAARQSLAGQLGVSAGEIYFDKVERWSWPNSCAITPTPLPVGAACVQVQLPGWRVILGANQVLYEFHTDVNGQVIQSVQAP